MPRGPSNARGGDIDLGPGLLGDPIPTIGDAPSADSSFGTGMGPGFFVGGLMADHELLGGCVFPVAMTFRDGDAKTRAECIVPPAADADLTLVANPVGPAPATPAVVGTIHFAAGTFTATITWAGSPYTLAAGVLLLLYAPSPADIQLALITGTINGSPAS